MIVGNSNYGDALNISRKGIQDAQKQANDAARNLSRVEPSDLRRLEETRSVERRKRDIVDDYVELSRSEAQAKTNATVFRSGTRVSEEVVNLGRRIDVTV